MYVYNMYVPSLSDLAVCAEIPDQDHHHLNAVG